MSMGCGGEIWMPPIGDVVVRAAMLARAESGHDMVRGKCYSLTAAEVALNESRGDQMNAVGVDGVLVLVLVLSIGNPLGSIRIATYSSLSLEVLT